MGWLPVAFIAVAKGGFTSDVSVDVPCVEAITFSALFFVLLCGNDAQNCSPATLFFVEKILFHGLDHFATDSDSEFAHRVLIKRFQF